MQKLLERFFIQNSMEGCDTRATKESLGLYFGDNPDHAALDRAGKT